MYGPADATFITLASSRVEQDVINALDSSARALGHATGCSLVTLEEVQERSSSVVSYIYEQDPWAVISIDDEALHALRSAFDLTAAEFDARTPCIVPSGVTLVHVPNFADCLEDDEKKRVAWNQMKAARHPGNPLS